jgi:Fe-S oxidoreductase
MALEDYRKEMETCRRCSACKFIPLEKVAGYEHVNVCPSIAKYNFHTYSAGGRMVFGVAMLENRIDYSDKLLEVVYNCQMCGACDVSCKYAMDMEVLEPIYEFRMKCVEDGHTLPSLDRVINSLRKQGTMVPGARVKRGEWAEGLDVKDITKEKAKVLYHVGCQTNYNRDMWKVAKATVNLLKKAGIETLVTSCADGYHAFKVLYNKYDLKGDLEVFHITEYLDRLLKEGKLKPTGNVSLNVTYHDPCHLGRLGEPWIRWEGREIPGHIRIFDPPKEFRRGTYGVYEPPRDILRSIPGLKLTEMDRIKEYAWCCGAGGGVDISNPEFAKWTAQERISEAETTGAEALVTACPWCEKTFNDTIKENGSNLKVYDIVELLDKAIQ